AAARVASIAHSGGVSVYCRSRQPFTITPDGCYEVADLLVDGNSVGAVSSYTLTNVTANHVVSASLALNTRITASAGAGGSISPATLTVPCGSDQTFSITPAACHHITDVLVDGVSVGAVSSYAFTNVTGAHSIAASFAIDVETLTAAAGAHGAISPAGPLAADCRSDQAFTIGPDAC